MATAAREDVAGDCTAFVCGSVVDVDNENHRICSACVDRAGKRKVPAADSAGRAQSTRPKATNGGSNKSQPRAGSRARPDFDAKRGTAVVLNGCLVFCGALPVVLVVLFSLATSKRVSQANRRYFVQTYSTVRAGVTAVVVA